VWVAAMHRAHVKCSYSCRPMWKPKSIVSMSMISMMALCDLAFDIRQQLLRNVRNIASQSQWQGVHNDWLFKTTGGSTADGFQ